MILLGIGVRSRVNKREKTVALQVATSVSISPWNSREMALGIIGAKKMGSSKKEISSTKWGHSLKWKITEIYGLGINLSITGSPVKL